MPTYDVDVGGKTYEVDAPDPNTAWRWANYTARQEAQKSERTWGEAVTDVGAGLVQGAGSLVSLPGQLYGLATGDFSPTGALGLGQSITQAGEEMKSEGLKFREAESAKAVQEAEKNGQLSAFATRFVETVTDPAQLSNFLATVVPQLILPAGAAKLAAGKVFASTLEKGVAAGLSQEAAKKAAQEAAIKYGTAAAKGAGATMQGAEVGTSSYEDIYKKLIEQGASETEAADQAIGLARSAGAGAGVVSFLAQSLPGASALEAKFAGKAGAGRIATGVKEAGSEMLEEAPGQAIQNLAMQQVDPTQSLMEGVGASAAQALIGGLGAGLTLGSGPSAAEQEQTKQKEQQAAFEEERKAEIDRLEKERAQTEKVFGVDKDQPLALPAPAEEADLVPEDRELTNPVGNIAKNELAPEVVSYIDKYRKDNGLPRLNSYSIEDVRDAMTQVNPAGEQAALDSILAAKTGYTGEEKFSTEDVLNAAVEKNIATDTKGFNDFLERTTGQSTLENMSQPQLYSAFKALKDMKRDDTTEQLVLPEGTNAARFTTKQYTNAVKLANMAVEESGGKLGFDSLVTEIKEATNLETDRDALAILDAAIKNEDLRESTETVFRTYKEGSDTPVATYSDKAKANEAAKKQRLNVKEETLRQIIPAEKAAPKIRPSGLPQGYRIEETTLAEAETPAAYGITVEGEGKPISTVKTQEEAPAKIERLQALRAKRAEQMDENIAKANSAINRGQAQLDRLEADGKGGTEIYQKLQAKQASRVKTLGNRIKLFEEQKAKFLAPLQVKPVGKRTPTRTSYKVTKGGETIGSFPSQQAAEESVISQLSDAELEMLAAGEVSRVSNRAAVELEGRRSGKKGIAVKGTKERLEKAGVETTEFQQKVKDLEAKLVPMLAKFGLKDVALKIVRQVEGGKAEGSYINKLIEIAMDAQNPIRTMRHEAIHALKNLGFFTPQQWTALQRQAKEKWVDKYLAGQMAEINGKVMTRLDAYKQLGLTESEIIEEAIADAFADFDVNGKAPAGLLQALFKRLQNFFKALRSAFGGAGFESAEEIFGKIEAGKLAKQVKTMEASVEKLSLAPKGIPQDIWNQHERSRLIEENAVETMQPQQKSAATRSWRTLNKMVENYTADDQAALKMMQEMNTISGIREAIANNDNQAIALYKVTNPGLYAQETGEKLSLNLRQGVPVSTVPIMEADDTEARAELGLNINAVRNRFNSVRDIAIALNKATKDAFGQMDQNNLTAEDMDRIAEAIADEVGYQLSTTSETGTGAGWYSTNYPNAVKRLAKRFPEFETNPTARSVFSALVAVSSNGERVATNIKNAIKMYERIRQGKKMIAVGSRRATALENNLIMIQDLLDEHGDNFEQELLKTTTVKDMNAALRAKGKKADTSYLADTTVPAAAIYFGPKLGAFFANLSGAEGYLTMDLWWSRTINRMRGLLIPKATDASINTFREMIDIPSASREEVVAATIPLAAKYKEYGFNTELEHLMKSKEPKEKVNKPKWFAKAEKVVGDAYEQLLYEHKLEKIANTIHKKEFEMLEEAPFTGTDRKFMYDAARKAQGILRSRGVNLTLADVQAALWYYEKRLYQKLSGGKADDIGYEEAINSQAAKGIGRARPSVVFGGKPDSGTVAGGEITGSEELRGILADSTSDERKYSLRSGVIVEVAPNPDQEVANKWREMTPDERLNTTKAVASKVVNRVLDELGFKGYTSYFSSGKYEGEVNPNIIIEAPDGASAEDLRELASVLGYVLDQKAMVAFDENNKSSGDQNTFIKVVPPSDMSEADLERLRKHIAESVPQADGDTLRDDALLFGNFSAYNDNVETLSDKQYHQAILDAIEFFDYDGTIRVSEPETFHSEMIWPESRSDYLKGTRYGKSGEVQGREGPDVRGSGISRLQTISDEAIALRDRWIDSRGSARRGGGGERSKVDIGQPAAEYGQKRENTESVIGVHFSQQPRAVLSSYFHGNGIRGLEKERLSDPANKDIRERVYFYIDTGRGVFPEESVGGVQHVIRLNNLYDIQKDPLKIVKTNTGVDAADRASKLERKILKAGYNGYVTRDPIQNQGFAVLVGDHYIKTNVGKFSLRTFFPTAEEAENAAYKKAPPSTPEFKRFFGASQVTEEGRPKVMFHASPNEFEEFSTFKPIFVSEDAKSAEFFASLKRLGKKSGRNYIYPLWVRAETPFDFENKDHVQRVVDYLNSEFDSWGRGKGKYIGPDLSMGRWNVIESKDVQNALKRLGFDSFYVKENDQKNLAVFGANQIKSITGNIGDFSLESKNMKLSLRDATEMFEPKEVAKKSQTDYKSRSKLISMRIDDFLSLSKSGVEPSKTALARDRVQDKIQFTSIPYLYVDTDGESLRVVGHEGRHRARALKEAGFTHMPVDLRTSNIRWSEQNDPDKYDYIKDWPVDIKAQSGAVSESFSIPMPVTREDATKNYEVPGAKLSLPIVSSAVEDRVNATTQPRVKEGWTKRMMDTIFPESFSSLRQGLINRYNQLSVYDRMLAEKMGGVELMADQRAESAALFSDLSAGVVSSALGVGERNGGVPVFKNGFTTIDTSTKGLTEILAPLARYNNPKIYQYYQYWSAVKRGTRLISEGRERLIEKGDIAYAQELQKQFPEFVQIQKEFNEFNNGLMAYAVSTNIISKEAAAEYTKYADYVPFYRQLNGEQTVGPRVFNAITGVKPPRKLKGGEAPLSDFLENSVRNVQAIVNAGMKNSAGLRAIDVAMKLGPDVGAEKLNQASSSPDTVTVLENGKPTSYRVADQLFIDAVKSLNMAEIPFIGFLSKPSEVLRNLVTRDPGFMFANLLRDSLSAYVTSGVKMTPIVGTMTNFTKALANKNPSMNALFNAGIIGGYEFSANVEASGERLGKDLEKKFGSKTAAGIALRPFTWTWEALEKGTTASDAATRTLIYDRVLAETGNEMEALSRALEVMNFNRRGSSSLIRILTASVPFLNARIQGLDVFYRASSGAMNNNDAKSIQKSFFIRGATMVWLSAMYFMAVSGDDEYQKQEQETKDNNWIIPSLKVKIPIPFEVGTLFKTIPERILALSFGEDTNKDFFEAMQRALLNTFAFNPTPQAIKPILETVVNYNFFTTRPLISQGMEDVAPPYQYTPNTSELAKWLGKEIGMSPIKIDHIMRGYTGTLGGYAVSLTDAALETVGASTKASKTFPQLPLVKRFAIDPDARGRVSDFYDLKNSIDQFVRTSNLLAKTAQPEKYQEYVKSNIGLALVKQRIRDMDKVMAKLREGRARVQNMDINPDAKRDLLTKIGRLENNTVANIQLIKRISTASSIEEARKIISRQ